MSESKYPDPWSVSKTGSEEECERLRQFQRSTILACAEEVGHRFYNTMPDKHMADCPRCKLLARAEEIK